MRLLLNLLALSSLCISSTFALSNSTSWLTFDHLYRSPKYKQTTVSRGFIYNYYFSPATADKPTLLFVHGFPSFSAHWIHQINFFEKEGYGLVVPDMLGYGGTSIPQDPLVYTHPAQAKDLIEILDAENLSNVVAIGHDWGSATVSRAANIYQDRFLGFAFLSVGYTPPDTVSTYEQRKEAGENELGYANLGYWAFFAATGAAEVINQHSRSLFDILWSRDPALWKYAWAPVGALQTFLQSDSSTQRATYISAEDMSTTERILTRGGWNGPLSYYKNEVSNVSAEADEVVPLESYTIVKPVLFIATAKDAVVVPRLFVRPVLELCPRSTTKIVNTGHWAFWEAADEVNRMLLGWLKGL
ncbi:alpha/beta-hydrolase [Coprinopsis marcescibilis]|uniref:Alpha/beta-hydrolase n=1 Tax=Coprinopsis marcescibilis TaxID=230819 RepID=A0A5C3KEW1_COPMA|nr:alpha/beta-hydrolase [Coprinopsis marcescibilis]